MCYVVFVCDNTLMQLSDSPQFNLQVTPQIFDGNAFAKEKETQLAKRVDALKMKGVFLQIGVVMFVDDPASRLYTRLKKEAARRVGIEFQISELQFSDSQDWIMKTIHQLSHDTNITGVMIQKPSLKIWQEVTGQRREQFSWWWQESVAQIDPLKDVDGLCSNQTKVLPATAQAVLDILEESPLNLEKLRSESSDPSQPDKKVAMIGRSDIVGSPIYYELKKQGVNVELLGRRELAERVENGQQLLDFDVVISATGQQGLVKGEMVKEGVVVIDVGEPKADIDFESVKAKASFITPVPGGVGPVTVVVLMENMLKLISHQD